MLKPNGSFAGNIDPLILLHVWAHHLSKNYSKMIFAGIGKPSYLLNEDVASAGAQYWISRLASIQASNGALSSAIDYDLPGGTIEARTIMATALSRWYETSIQPDEVIFTVGGISGLRMLFSLLKNPEGKIVTPSPYYPFYNTALHGHSLYTMNVLNKATYRLTAELLEEAVEDLKKQNTTINAFLFCDPWNPMGSVVGNEEWTKIAEILRQTPKQIPIILDEAYGEMTFFSKHVSLLQVAPDLKERIIILRSGTKGFSASGERLAILICSNEEMREKIFDEILSTYIHAPKSLQLAYAHGMAGFTEEKRRDLAHYYQIQVQYVQKRIREMGISLPMDAYRVDGTFYVLANLSVLFGKPIPASSEQALGKKGPITTDEEICYSLLFEDQVMISPLSYFGADPTLGYVRITCSGGIPLLSELLDRLENKSAVRR